MLFNSETFFIVFKLSKLLAFFNFSFEIICSVSSTVKSLKSFVKPEL